MDQEESLTLYKKGVGEWNKWANERRAELVQSKAWNAIVDDYYKLPGGFVASSPWLNAASVDFSGHEFQRYADFRGFVFPAHAAFNLTKLQGGATFDNAQFMGFAGFHLAFFDDFVLFQGVNFNGTCDFSQALFKGQAYFRETTFAGNALFYGIQGERFFSIEKASFATVPDFNQAHFAEAPQLDQSHFGTIIRPWRFCGTEQTAHSAEAPQLELSPFWTAMKPWHIWGNQRGDLSGRWRALKRLAIQGHDHESEQMFFAEELKSLRGERDRLLPNPFNLFKGVPVWPGGGRYWMGLLYQILSSFGRSMSRPLVAWILTFLVCTWLFIGYHLEPNDPLGSSYRWTMGTATKPAFSNLSCFREPSGDAITAAIYLSLHNGLIFSGLGGSEKLLQSYACLYGGTKSAPIMPDAVVLIGFLQTLLSSIIVFLFLLALRNIFRIK